MDWQRLITDVGLEVLPDGTFAYRSIVCTVPRQQGKTLWTLAMELHRAVMWGSPQNIAYTAQTGRDAAEKLLHDQVPILEAGHPIGQAVRKIHRANGAESVTFDNGSRLFVLASTAEAGHGKVIDQAVLDEAFADEDSRREMAVLPAMLTRKDAQLIIVSTAGTERSSYLKRLVDAGRASVADGETTGTAYFEWSADEDAPPGDPATWYSCMPALGVTIGEAAIAHAYKSHPEGEFRRAYLNQWTASSERVIPVALWDAVNADDVKPDGRLTFAVDVSADRTSAAIAAADDEGRVEIIEHAEGVGWAVHRVIELAKRWDAPVILDTYGPAAGMVGELEAAEVDVVALTTREMAEGCARFYDGVADLAVQIHRHPALDAAAAVAKRRSSGDAWLWARKDAGDDVSPLIAATMAYSHAVTAGDGSVFFAWGA